jgi:phage shock protein C
MEIIPKEGPKRLKRSIKDKMLAGVCGGLADYFEIDPSLIRLAFVLAVLLGGTGVLAYLVMWIIVPKENLNY